MSCWWAQGAAGRSLLGHTKETGERRSKITRNSSRFAKPICASSSSIERGSSLISSHLISSLSAPAGRSSRPGPFLRILDRSPVRHMAAPTANGNPTVRYGDLSFLFLPNKGKQSISPSACSPRTAIRHADAHTLFETNKSCPNENYLVRPTLVLSTVGANASLCRSIL